MGEVRAPVEHQESYSFVAEDLGALSVQNGSDDDLGGAGWNLGGDQQVTDGPWPGLASIVGESVYSTASRDHTGTYPDLSMSGWIYVDDRFSVADATGRSIAYVHSYVDGVSLARPNDPAYRLRGRYQNQYAPAAPAQQPGWTFFYLWQSTDQSAGGWSYYTNGVWYEDLRSNEVPANTVDPQLRIATPAQVAGLALYPRLLTPEEVQRLFAAREGGSAVRDIVVSHVVPDAIRFGDQAASRMYLGAEQVWPVRQLSAYAQACVDLGAVFVQNGNIDEVTGRSLVGGTDPGLAADGIAAWAGDWSFLLDDPVPRGITVIGLIRRNAINDGAYHVPGVELMSATNETVYLYTRQLLNTKGGGGAHNWTYSQDVVESAYGDARASKWVAQATITSSAGLLQGRAYKRSSSSWIGSSVTRSAYYGGAQTVTSMVKRSEYGTPDGLNYTAGLAVFPSELTQEQAHGLLEAHFPTTGFEPYT